MEITLDVSKLTTAEVDLIEDTLNERMGSRLGANIVSFSDLMETFRWEKQVKRAEEAGTPPPPFPPGVVRVSPIKFMRAVELVHLRRSNPSATWDDTGQDPVFPGITEAPPAPSEAQWPTPEPPAPSV